MTETKVLPKPASMLERELSQDTLAAIKAIVQEEQVQTAAAAPSKTPTRQPVAKHRPAPQTRASLQRRRRKQQPVSTDHVQPHEPQKLARFKAIMSKGKPVGVMLRQYLTPRRLAVAVIIVALWLEPWFLPTVLVLTLFFGTLIALLLGPDRMRHYAELGWKRFERRQPQKASELRLKAMYRLNSLQRRLDKLPSRWTQGLYLPQVPAEADHAAADSAYAQRMARMAQDQRRQGYS